MGERARCAPGTSDAQLRELADALAATVAGNELPAVPRADQAVALDEAITDPATIVRTLVVDDDQRATRQPRDRDRTRAISGGDDATDRHEAQLVKLWPAVVGVVPELVENLRVEGSHQTHATRPV